MKKRMLIRRCLVSALASVIAWSHSSVALAADYVELHGENAVKSHALSDAIVDVVQYLLTSWMLPIGILLSVWRSVYYAVFCVLAHTDPLHLLNEKNLSMIRSTTGTSAKARTQLRRQRALEDSSPAFGDFESVEPEIGIAALKDELRRTARSLIVVTSMWVFFQMIIYIVSFFLGRFD